VLPGYGPHAFRIRTVKPSTPGDVLFAPLV
jgi:hypothetical protein